MRKAGKYGLLLLLMSVIPLTIFTSTEGPSDPAPVIEPTVDNENAGKKILFDNTHGQTAGAADWVIDGAFSDFGHGLAAAGFYVKELRKQAPITVNDLTSYDVFVIGEANIPYKVSEQNALLHYVEQGGSIFFIGDHYNADRNKNRWDANEIFNGYRRGAYNDPGKGMSEEEKGSEAMEGVTSSNWLEQHFGLRFRYNALGNITADHIIAPEQTFSITKGVNEVAMHAGSTLAITDPERAKGIVYLPKTNQAWPYAVDQGVYAGGGKEEGPYAAISKVKKGKAAFIGDSSPVEDRTPKYLREETGERKKTYDGFSEKDDAIFLVQLVDWLADQEDYKTFSEVDGIQLDQPTPLLAFEEPKTSTEPEPEPWSAPAAGYQWWNPSTFKPGSYGSEKEAPAKASYTLLYQSTLPNRYVFPIRLKINGTQPGSTVEGVQISIYLPGGQQVAKVKQEDGKWPSHYGYSQPVAIPMNEKGEGSKEFTVRINSTVEGSAHLRLRIDGENIKTEKTNIAAVDVVPLPAYPVPFGSIFPR